MNKEALIAEFAEYLNTARTQTGKIEFKKELAKPDKSTPKATLEYTKLAMDKIQALVAGFTGEVGWHGTVTRNENHFTITDILVYPQEVTGATVNTDQVEYTQWMMSIPDDETYNSLRYQGHSHVNFGITPSSVDLDMYERILENLGAEDFYIFGIYNKRKDCFLAIYDFKNNLIYEKSDIKIISPDDTFLEEAKKVVKEKKYETTTFGHYQSQVAGARTTKTYNSYKDAPSQRRSQVEELTLEEERRIRDTLGYGYYDGRFDY